MVKKQVLTLSPFWEGFGQVLSDPAMGNEVHHGEEQERLVRCAMAGDLRVLVSAPDGPKVSEHLEVFVEHLPE